ncbi:hypothetical protein ACQZ61_07455 [Agrobacterium vitis]|uniref:hypothetical protein n=1 Tax=Agrobacterium vitis TaxID=373 RepID=UPI0015DB0AE6|nr:hypothetical protein [Agrobacterium vitis]MCF1454279.1 hypothetical protein [Agrobacterium vitis]BCH55072.1 hypothetical protein RvVAR031_26820 [Agrobacterium vitis]
MDLELLFSLISQQGTLEQVSNFLKERDLPHSANSWQVMINSRLRPPSSDGRLTLPDLIDLLRQTEEHGGQHIFFYKLVAGRSIKNLFDGNLPNLLMGASFPSLGTTSLVEMPDNPTIVEIRQEAEKSRAVCFKIVEKRTILEKVSNESANNGQIVVTYNQVPYRAVNMMRIQENGLAEIRIQSSKDAVSYGGNAEAVFRLLNPVVDRLDWMDENLDKFKFNLLDAGKRNELQTVFGLKHTQHSNTFGTRLSAAAGGIGSSMYDDADGVASLDRFLQNKGHAHCERVTINMKRHGPMHRSVGMLVTGEANEMAITSKVSKSEYEYIVSKVLENNT